MAELIAAGEVVERPASVVKELVENAIDAGSASVTVEIKNGGITFLRVTDDGSGIARDDVNNAFVSHATSKISDGGDLDFIATLGFRGEALASIAAVSRVTMLTKTADELAGTQAVVEGGSSVTIDDAGCPTGTTIIVRDLFYNTPARMKFLKRDASEGNAVAACVQRMALSHPEVSFRLIREQKTVMHTSGDSSLMSCAYGVFGREFAAGLIETQHEYAGVQIKGLVSKPEESRGTRGMQHFFVNGRYVRTRTAMAALEEGFKGTLMVGRFPSCVLHLTLAYDAVDVNVHPAKIEVRFVNERAVFDAVYFAVKNALMASDAPPRLQTDAVPGLHRAMQPPAPRQIVEQQRIVPAEDAAQRSVPVYQQSRPAGEGGSTP
ncbi:MAG: DNA mismatch repair endonuclease MutL, partial [Acetanaerobacterium sp.]